MGTARLSHVSSIVGIFARADLAERFYPAEVKLAVRDQARHSNFTRSELKKFCP
jgi:hypothetical protein